MFGFTKASKLTAASKEIADLKEQQHRLIWAHADLLTWRNDMLKRRNDMLKRRNDMLKRRNEELQAELKIVRDALKRYHAGRPGYY
jgi:3-dehydroquinate dehydratase